ncbi:MAG: hypothetical protein EXR73_13185 [Myxococcales bacterium]|nr:hypothetical protein [Myxococcales bacterium]
MLVLAHRTRHVERISPLVDTVLHFDPLAHYLGDDEVRESDHGLRVLRAVKNRFAPVAVAGLRMTPAGLVALDPDATKRVLRYAKR